VDVKRRSILGRKPKEVGVRRMIKIIYIYKVLLYRASWGNPISSLGIWVEEISDRRLYYEKEACRCKVKLNSLAKGLYESGVFFKGLPVETVNNMWMDFFVMDHIKFAQFS
jgi:hypothetical protein